MIHVAVMKIVENIRYLLHQYKELSGKSWSPKEANSLRQLDLPIDALEKQRLRDYKQIVHGMQKVLVGHAQEWFQFRSAILQSQSGEDVDDLQMVEATAIIKKFP